MRRVPRFLLTFLTTSQHDIASPEPLLGQAKEQSAGPDLYVVWMRAYGEQGQRLI
jgi:hypothetical protein